MPRNIYPVILSNGEQNTTKKVYDKVPLMVKWHVGFGWGGVFLTLFLNHPAQHTLIQDVFLFHNGLCWSQVDS